MFEQVGSTWGMAVAHRDLAEDARGARNWASAGAHARASLTMSQQVRQPMMRTRGFLNGLAELARLSAARGQPERAARLWGAACALRREAGERLEARERAEFDAEAAGARATLEGHLSVWPEGEAMNLEQALAYALEDG